MGMNSKEFVAKLKDIVAKFKTVYMWGTFGAPVTDELISHKSEQYPSWYTFFKRIAFKRLIEKNFFGFDCIGLIKGGLWG
jgi:hypothetical protein